MAAELTYDLSGIANVFSVRVPMWHKEGHLLSEEPDFDTALEKGGHIYSLEKKPYLYEDANGKLVQSDTSYYIYRPDTDKVLGKVGSDYEIVDNRTAFEVLRPLIDSGLFSLETGGTLRDGADAWLMGKWNFGSLSANMEEIFGVGGIIPYSAVLANHTGRRAVLIGNTPIRIVCANTLGMAETARESAWISVPHFKGAAEKLKEEAEKLFNRTVERYEIIALQYKALKAKKLAENIFNNLVLDVVAPDPRLNPKFNPEAKLAASVVERAERKRAELRRMWFEGKGHSGDASAWEAYNGTVEALDFNTELWPSRAGSFRTASMLTGQIANMKQTVLNNLYQASVAV